MSRPADALLDEAALGEVLLQHAVGVVAQLRQAELVVALRQDVQRLFDRRRLLVFAQRLLCAVGRGHVGAAPVVVARHVQFVLRQRVDDVVHAHARVGGVLGGGELVDQLLERLVRVARGLLVALGHVLARDRAQDAEVVVEVHQALQVHRVVERRAGRVQLDEAVERALRLRALAGLPVGVGQLELRLLRQQRAGGAAFHLFSSLMARS